MLFAIPFAILYLTFFLNIQCIIPLHQIGFKCINVFCPINGTFSALDLFRDNILMILTKRSGIHIVEGVTSSSA